MIGRQFEVIIEVELETVSCHTIEVNCELPPYIGINNVGQKINRTEDSSISNKNILDKS